MSVVRSPVRSVVRPVVRGVFGFEDSSIEGDDMAIQYRAGNLYPAIGLGIGTGVSLANVDCIMPFSPRRNVTVDRVAWYRDNTTAANVYVGIYSSAGVLLTDCAVDTDTVVGWKAVNTTDVALVQDEIYWLAWNASVDVAGTWALASSATLTSISPTYEAYVETYGMAVGIGTADNVMAGAAQQKARTNAALLSTLTMSGFSLLSLMPGVGIVAA